MHVSKGVRAGQPLVLTSWQQELLTSLYERRADGLTIACSSIVDAGHPNTELEGGLGTQVVAPLRHPASVRRRLDLVAPRREVEVEHRALERERLPWVGRDDPALSGPLVLAVAVVTFERRPDDRCIGAIQPLARAALFRPLAHSCDVRNRVVDRVG